MPPAYFARRLTHLSNALLRPTCCSRLFTRALFPWPFPRNADAALYTHVHALPDCCLCHRREARLRPFFLFSHCSFSVRLRHPPPPLPPSPPLSSASPIRLVIDWHNFAFSLLALSLAHGPPSSTAAPLPFSRRALLWVAERYERACGRWGHDHVTVCNAMGEELKSHWVSAREQAGRSLSGGVARRLVNGQRLFLFCS